MALECVLHMLPGALPSPPSFTNILDLLQGCTSLEQLLLALHYT